MKTLIQLSSLATLFFTINASADAGPVSTVKIEDGKSLYCQYQSDLGGVGYQLNLPIAIAKQDHVEFTVGLFGVQCSRSSTNQVDFKLRLINDPFQNGFVTGDDATTVHILAHHALLLTSEMKIIGKQLLENEFFQVVKFALPLSNLLTKKQRRDLKSGTEVLVTLEYFNRARIEYRQASHVEAGGEQDGGAFRLSFTLRKDLNSQKLIASPVQIH